MKKIFCLLNLFILSLTSCNKNIFSDVIKPTIDNIDNVFIYNIYEETLVSEFNSLLSLDDFVNEFISLNFYYVGENCKCAPCEENITFYINGYYYFYSDIKIIKSNKLQYTYYEGRETYFYGIRDVDNFDLLISKYF